MTDCNFPENCFFLISQENVGLKNLNLRMNGFGLEGAKAMAQALIHNRTLMELDLSHNRIPLQGAIALGRGINCNDVLVTIRVSLCSCLLICWLETTLSVVPQFYLPAIESREGGSLPLNISYHVTNYHEHDPHFMRIITLCLQIR